MNKEDLRGAYHQAKHDEKSSNILFLEVFIISFALGFYFQSWYVGLVSFLLLCLSLAFKRLNIFLCVIFTLIWTFIGWYIGYAIDGMLAGILGGVFAFVIGCGIHISAFTYMMDFLKD
ncbi:hypothetical protein EV694_1827 [Volucribacter psittacicida]|uniref:Uncharacterized protein n=1 Tax=Volucribacter psittacicida TaxID=203482 RepID=A0A4R1FLZ1_9PAST|nr:hypothetical protein [Volucribacter psittacicida]TCJ95827.1 hypothetical protein EV694_1827 [Volucribacter psittacicida]